MKQPYFFVLGVPKSGTTWAQHLLDAHPQLMCRSEGKFLAFRHELAKAASAYSDTLGSLHRELFGDEFFPPVSRDEFDQLYRTFMELRLRSGGIAHGVRRIGNKDPEHGTALTELSGHFPDAAYIQIIRDPRDTVIAAWHHMRRINPVIAKDFGSLAEYAPKVVEKWQEYIQVVRARAAAVRLDYCEARYEDLQADPRGSLKRLYDFLDVESSPPVVAAALEKASFERLSGGRSRGQDEPASFFRKGVVGDWCNHLSAHEAKHLLDMTNGLARELGYR